MDLLGSILNNMQKPPVAGVSKEKEMEKSECDFEKQATHLMCHSCYHLII